MWENNNNSVTLFEFKIYLELVELPPSVVMVHRHVEVVDFRGINLFSVLQEIAYFYFNF